MMPYAVCVLLYPFIHQACYSCDSMGQQCTTGTGDKGAGAGESNSDLVIYVGAKNTGACNTSTTTLALASNCALEATLDR